MKLCRVDNIDFVTITVGSDLGMKTIMRCLKINSRNKTKKAIVAAKKKKT